MPSPTSVSTLMGLHSQPSPGIPGKVNITSPSGNPLGQVWLLSPNLWSVRLQHKNRWYLGKFKKRTEKRKCFKTPIHIRKSSQEQEFTAPLTRNVMNLNNVLLSCAEGLDSTISSTRISIRLAYKICVTSREIITVIYLLFSKHSV